jgi:hypothetical protein
MSVSTAETVLTFIIGAIGTISGWAAYTYQYLSDRPKIKVKLLNVMRGRFKNPKNPSEDLTSFMLFIYLTNLRKNAVHIKDYILEVDDGNGFKRMKKIYGDLSHFDFTCADGEIQIPNFEQGLIYKISKPVEFGVPYYGYLFFGGDPKYYDAEIKRFRITCIDVLDHKHETTAKPAEFTGDLFYLQEVFNIKFPRTDANSGIYRPSYNRASGNLISGNDITSRIEGEESK